ncbi:hypothetical protein CsSME_00000614 [Camellia sinensis var. sinensis]
MDDQSNSTTTKNNSNSGQLETSKAERAVWLMKCPPVVSRSLQCPPPSSDAFDSSRPVAKVVVSIDPLRSNDDSSSRKLSVEGKIFHKFDMKPHNENIEEYGKLCRERTNKYMTKTRQIQVIDNDNGTHMRPLPGMIGLKTTGPSDKKKVPAKSSDMKRTRRDRGEMEQIMFKLFERQPNWTLKQLLHETDQPEQFLKDLLKDLCVYNNKGTNQGSYELKPEYKKSVEEPESI